MFILQWKKKYPVNSRECEQKERWKARLWQIKFDKFSQLLILPAYYFDIRFAVANGSFLPWGYLLMIFFPQTYYSQRREENFAERMSPEVKTASDVALAKNSKLRIDKKYTISFIIKHE